jgi:hypothetical protein
MHPTRISMAPSGTVPFNPWLQAVHPCGADLDPASSGADLDPASSGADLDPASSGVGLDPASSGVGLDPVGSGAGRPCGEAAGTGVDTFLIKTSWLL